MSNKRRKPVQIRPETDEIPKKGEMGPFLNEAQWSRIVAIYAKHNGRIWSASCELGWPVARTRRVWTRGYPKQGLPPVKTILARDELAAEEIHRARQDLEADLPPSEPIESIEDLEAKAVVISERESARVRMMVKREEDRQRAREDAVKARGEEAMLVQVNRRNSLALNGITAQLLRGASALSGVIQQELEAIAAGKDSMTTSQKLALVRAAAGVARFNSESSMLAVKTERMVLGQPIDAPDGEVSDGALDEAVNWIETSMRALQRARERGLITSGSGSAPTGPKH